MPQNKVLMWMEISSRKFAHFQEFTECFLCVQMVSMENAEEYVELMFDFCMHTGIQKQMEAFRGKCAKLANCFSTVSCHCGEICFFFCFFLENFTK